MNEHLERCTHSGKICPWYTTGCNSTTHRPLNSYGLAMISWGRLSELMFQNLASRYSNFLAMFTHFLTTLALSALIINGLGCSVCQAEEAAPAPPARPVKPVSIAALNRMQKEADAAMEAKDYATVVTKTEELLKVLPEQSATKEQMEQLYFNIGLANLLGEHFPEAEKAFTECATKYPNGLLASRCVLGVAKACIAQDTTPKLEQAAMALRVAKQNPKFNAEAEALLAELNRERVRRMQVLEASQKP